MTWSLRRIRGEKNGREWDSVRRLSEIHYRRAQVVKMTRNIERRGDEEEERGETRGESTWRFIKTTT
jgi:hypothetical protein